MSVNCHLHPAHLLCLDETKTASGARKAVWIKARQITIAIYQTDQRVAKDCYRHTETTHTGLTYARELLPGRHRIEQSGKVYELLACDCGHRLSILSLKGVDAW